MSSNPSFGELIVQIFRWVWRALFSAGRKLDIGWCAVLPHKVHHVFEDHPDAMIAGEFVNMLRNNPNLCGFYEQITLDLLKLKARYPGHDIYVHSPQIV